MTFLFAYLAMLCGFFAGQARGTLARAWSIRPKAQCLVTDGFYSFCRHPMYFFSTLGWTFATAAAKPSLAWVPLGLLGTIQTLRAYREEGVLEDAFGDEYREYKRKVRW